jgi:protein tyrosine phosphatase domain-containing protein 1
MSTPTLDLALNVAQLMHFVISIQKKKVAIHCHAGLGRTGLIIACYLIFTGLPSKLAIEFVRQKRRGAVQSLSQERFVLKYESYLKELRIIFAIPKAHSRFTFDKAIRRQQRYLHGIEQQLLRFIPKVSTMHYFSPFQQRDYMYIMKMLIFLL